MELKFSLLQQLFSLWLLCFNYTLLMQLENMIQKGNKIYFDTLKDLLKIWAFTLKKTDANVIYLLLLLIHQNAVGNPLCQLKRLLSEVRLNHSNWWHDSKSSSSPALAQVCNVTWKLAILFWQHFPNNYSNWYFIHAIKGAADQELEDLNSSTPTAIQ